MREATIKKNMLSNHLVADQKEDKYVDQVSKAYAVSENAITDLLIMTFAKGIIQGLSLQTNADDFLYTLHIIFN
jgi:hypothetical protein